MGKSFLAQAGFCCAADSLLSEAGSSSVDLSSSCSGIAQKWWNQWGHFKSIACPLCFLELALTQVSSVCPTLPLLLPHKPRDDLALCAGQKLFCVLLGILLSCGSCFSKNANAKDAATLSQSGQKRHDICHSSWTIYYTFGISQCAEHPDTNTLTPSAHTNTHILKIVQQTALTCGPEV